MVPLQRDTLSRTREANRRNAKKPPGHLPQNGRSPGGIEKDELHPSQLTKGEAHKNLAVKRPTAMAAGRGMGTTAAMGTAAAAAATADMAVIGGGSAVAESPTAGAAVATAQATAAAAAARAVVVEERARQRHAAYVGTTTAATCAPLTRPTGPRRDANDSTYTYARHLHTHGVKAAVRPPPEDAQWQHRRRQRAPLSTRAAMQIPGSRCELRRIPGSRDMLWSMAAVAPRLPPAAR